MVIDVFSHFFPKGYIDYIQKLDPPIRFHNSSEFTDPRVRIDEMDRHEITMQVLTLSTPAFQFFGPGQGEQARQLAMIANDGIAEIVDRYPGRFIGVATLPMISPDAALEELDRAINHLGFKGIQIFSNINGKPIDGPEFFPIYDRMVKYDLPILLHPAGGDYNECTRDYMLWLTFGWPLDTSLAMARLVYTGVLEKYPQLKIITHHLGAFVPYLSERINDVSATVEKSLPWKLSQPALSYFRQFYGDTAVHGNKYALDAGYEFFGSDRILFGTDYPFVPMGKTVQSVLEWKIPERDKGKILSENGRRLFKI